MKEIIIRDTRRKEKFVVDDEYLNGYAKLCGINATGVYICLCRHADYHTQECFPSIETMAGKLDVSVASIKRGLMKLVEWNIIKKDRTRHPTNAKWVNNSYTLLDKSVWKEKPQLTQSRGTTAHKVMEPQLTDDKSHSSQGASKVTHNTKVTHIEGLPAEAGGAEINKMIDLFKDVNPSFERLFPNKNQRSAVERLIKKFGSEKVVGMIKSLEAITSQKYAPKITTPIELERDLGKLVAFYKQNNQPKGKLVI